MNKTREIIVVDANPLLSALSGGRDRSILLSGKFRFITAEHTTREVKKYITRVAELTGVAEAELLFALDHFPIIAFQLKEYDDKRATADRAVQF